MPNNAPSAKLVIRYVLIAILVVALVVLAFDYRARTSAQAAYDKLQARDLEQVRSTPDDVHELLNRQPDGPAQEAQGEMIETYAWTGFRSYTVYVVYSRVVGIDAGTKGAYTMEHVTLNQKP